MNASDEKRVVNVREFRKNLSGFLRRARHGETIVIASRGQEVARLTPPGNKPRGRSELIGMFKQQLRISADFDETPAELVELMEHGM